MGPGAGEYTRERLVRLVSPASLGAPPSKRCKSSTPSGQLRTRPSLFLPVVVPTFTDFYRFLRDLVLQDCYSTRMFLQEWDSLGRIFYHYYSYRFSGLSWENILTRLLFHTTTCNKYTKDENRAAPASSKPRVS